MTCVVAVVHKSTVYMGADSAGVGGYSHQTRVDPKIYKVGQMLIGFTTSFRMGQLLGYRLTVPDHDPRVPIEKYMATAFVDAVRDCLKAGGYAAKDRETEQGGTFLVGYRGRLFRIDSDYQVGERLEPYDAVGCGEDLALGALYATSDTPYDPEKRLQVALQAAASFSAGVRAPFIFEQVGF
jgi:ATP-dependent protease HslVU (ClpYQ) peptidase subunit